MEIQTELDYLLNFKSVSFANFQQTYELSVCYSSRSTYAMPCNVVLLPPPPPPPITIFL